jgi:porin
MSEPTWTGLMARLSGLAALLFFHTTLGVSPARAEDWQRLTDQLTKAGVTPTAVYDGGAAANMSGGVKQGTIYSGNLHLQLALDGEHLAGLPGLTAFLDGLWINAGQPSKYVGDAQGVSNIAAPPTARLYEAWLQYNFPGSRISILAGLYDLSTEFYHINSGDLFLNGSFGTGPEFGLSGLGGPSIYPATSLGLRLAYKPSLNSVLRLAIMDGEPLWPSDGSPDPFNTRNGLLLVGEAAFLTRAPTGDPPPGPQARKRIGRLSKLSPYDDKIAVGAWYYTTGFNDLGASNPNAVPEKHHGEGGAYLLVDHLLFQSVGDPNRRLAGFVQLGVAEDVVDRIGTYVGAGLVASGVFPGRPDDQLGIAVAMARNGSGYISAQRQAGLPVSPAETSIELSYLAQVASWLAVQPDIQYVISPDTDPRLQNATVAQLRFEVTF